MTNRERVNRLTGLDTVQGALDTIETYFENGWTDGLPIVPPTEAMVAEFVAASGRDGGEVLGLMPPRMGVVSVEAAATNAVMAGCLPEYMPVVLAAAEAALDPVLDIRGLQATSDPAAPLVIVSGPVVEQLGINHGVGLFGHGSRANATIGRALRLMMINLGDGRLDTGDKSTMGSPSKYSYCMGTDVDTPWAPIHTDFGFDASESCVTVFAADGPRGNNPAGSGSMEFALWLLADSLRNLNPNMIHGGHTLVVISPLIAHGLHAEGWSKRDVQLYLYERARVPIERVRRYKELRYGRNVEAGEPYFWPKWLDVDDPTEPEPMIPIVRDPDNVMIAVAGDPARSRSAFCPARPYNRPVSKAVRMPG